MKSNCGSKKEVSEAKKLYFPFEDIIFLCEVCDENRRIWND